MADKKSFGEKLEVFFTGKGFYIVLFLCVAVIGVSAYVLLAGNGSDVDDVSGEISGYQEMTDGNRDDPELAAPPAAAEEPEKPAAEEDGEALENATDEQQTGNMAEPQPETEAAAQYIWPLEGSIEVPYSVTSLIYSRKMGDWRTHDGVDIAAPLGTQVLAVSAGTIEKVYTDDLGGTTVIIAHAGGLCSVYSNLAAVPTVKEGDNIMTGEILGAVGATAPGETRESPHLLFRMTLDGQSVNPVDYLPPR